MVILTLNCGSSSAKYQVYDWEQKDRAIEQVRIIGGKAYFFAVRDNKED